MREGSPLAAGKWQKWWESVGLSWVMTGCLGLAGMRAEKALWRVTGSCRGVSEMDEEGESVTRCRRLFRSDMRGVGRLGDVMGCRIEAEW